MDKTTSKRCYGFCELLTSNAKLRKRSKRYLTRGLVLAPATTSGHNVCPMAGYCAKICVLWFAGRTVMNATRQAAIARTKLFFENRETFFELLHNSIEQFVSHCGKRKAKACVRLNTASDLAYEKLNPALFENFPTVTFYDYTKITNRAFAYGRGELPANYHLTYSYSERSDDAKVRELLEMGVNVAVIVDTPYNPQHGTIGKLQKTMIIDGKRFACVDGDKHDFRIPDLDGRGNIILLRGKGGIASVLAGVFAGLIKPVRGGRHATHELATT